jgi:hypothetical protein
MATTFHAMVQNQDLRLEKIISQEIRILLKDSTNLRNTPFVDYCGSINGSGSDTIRVRKAGLDAGDFSAFTGTTEANAVSDATLAQDGEDIVVKRQALAYALSDLGGMTELSGAVNGIDPFRIAESIAASYDKLFADLTGATVAGFTTVKGATGAANTVGHFIDAIQALEAAASNKGAPGPYVALLHPKQWADIQDNILVQNSGILQFVPASYEAISAKGSHYKGSFLGVEIYTSSHITNDGTDHLGALFAPGALGFANGMPAALPGAVETMEMGEVLIEMDREADKALTRIVGHCYLGMSIIDDDRGVLFKGGV